MIELDSAHYQAAVKLSGIVGLDATVARWLSQLLAHRHVFPVHVWVSADHARRGLLDVQSCRWESETDPVGEVRVWVADEQNPAQPVTIRTGGKSALMFEWVKPPVPVPTELRRAAVIMAARGLLGPQSELPRPGPGIVLPGERDGR